MPKKTWNILSFSEGLNFKQNSKDIDAKGFEFSNNYISFNEGSIATKGLFDTVPGLNLSAGGFQQNLSFQGTPNLYKVFPEMGFRKFGKAKYTSSGTLWQELDSNNGTGTVNHGLDVGTKFIVIDSGDNVVSGGIRNASLVGEIATVTSLSTNSKFQSTLSGMSNGDEIFYAICSDYDENHPLKSNPSSSYGENKFLITSQNSKFGFYNLGVNKSWFGKLNGGSTNVFGNDSWFFDGRYLWDTQQHSSYNAAYKDIIKTDINNAFYETSAFRVLPEAPPKYFGGRCVRPFGLYAIEREQHRFSENAYVIYPGWYALRSHILAPDEYHRMQEDSTDDVSDIVWNEEHNNEWYKGAGTVNINSTPQYTFDNLATDAGNPIGPAGYTNQGLSSPFQVSLAVSHGQSTDGDAPGDWQFLQGDTHAYLKFGMSYLYDTIEEEFALESTIAPITLTDGSEGWVNMTQGSPQADKALILSWFFYIGENQFTENQNLMFNSFDEAVPNTKGVAEFRGSGMNNGFSNNQCLNPRIVGARIYLMGDYANYDGEGYNEYEEPLYLAKIDFTANKHGMSHDNFKSSDWSSSSNSADGVYGQKIVIPGVPVLTYKLINTYEHNDSIHTWYKTAAVVNRKLYAGNVHYFDKNQVNWDRNKPVHKPDRILISPPNKFDILPSANYLDVMQGDGQDITHIEGFNNKLLVFKNDDMFLIDCSGEFEILESTNKGLGVENSMKVVQSPVATYWVNSSGVWGYDIENPISNIVANKFDAEKWHSEIYSNKCFLKYEPKSKMLLLFTRYQGKHFTSTDEPTNIIYINTITGAVFFKNELAKNYINAVPSGAVIADNFLYTTISDASVADLGHLHVDNTTVDIPATKQSGCWSFRVVNDNTYDYQFYNNSLRRLSVRYRTGEASEYDNWDELNSTDFTLPQIASPDETNYDDVLAVTQLQIDHFNAKVNNTAETETHPTSSSEYADIYTWNLDRTLDGGTENQSYFVTYHLFLEAKNYGTTDNLTDSGSAAGLTGVQESLSVYGTTCVGFTDGSGSNGIRNTPPGLSTWTQEYHTPGINHTNGVWNVYVDRRGDYSVGESFVLISNVAAPNEPSPDFGLDFHETSADANDSNIVGDYKVGSSGAKWTNALNSSNATASLRTALLNNDHFNQFYTIGSLQTGDESAVTGLAGESDNDSGTDHYSYFTITAKGSTFPGNSFDIYWGQSSHSGGTVYRFNPASEHSTSNTLITKDIDFNQPGIRKKIYKAYVTYKTSASPTNNISVEYMINGNGTWNTAILKNSNNEIVTSIPASTEWNRFTIEDNDSVKTNSIYSIQYKISGSAYIEIDDMSIIYRDKPPR
jgi:hypothetical protein